MNEALQNTGMILEMEGDEQKCPFRLISFSEGLLCFDPWLTEYVKPAKEIIGKWCISNFRSCPNFLTYRRNLRAGMRKHFML